MSETEPSLTDCEECIAPAEAFSVVANETRLDILEALWDADERPVSFSDLRRAVGMRDSAQFNYHLGKLQDQFVRKTDDGYDFRHAGRAVVHAVLSGTLNEHPRIEPFEVAGDCTDCGEELQARYEDELITVECSECGRLHVRYAFPPGGLAGRTTDEVMEAFNQRVRHLHCLTADGVCPECNGRVETTLSADDDKLGLEAVVEHECRRCRHTLTTSVGLVLLDHSEVVSFYRDHGIDLNAVPFWTLDWCTSDEHTTVRSTDPWEVVVTVPLDDERLRVVLDGDLQVIESDRAVRTGVASGAETA